MSASSTPRKVTLKVDGSIAFGKAVHYGSDKDHVVVASSKTKACKGICQTETVTTAEDKAEIALPGGGALAKLGGSVTQGDLLVPDTDGRLIGTVASGDKACARAEQTGVANDIIAVEVLHVIATAAAQ